VTDLFPCPYLEHDVELTEERRRHILVRHPEVLPRYERRIRETLLAPECVVVRHVPTPARLFVRWYDTPGFGRYVVVVVVTDRGEPDRHWIVTAYTGHDLPDGELEWQPS
jgi:hypothetical protein